jgi:putative redox protein
MRSDKIFFTNRQGIDLAARFDRPDTEPAAYALAAHCFTCTKDIPAMHRISTALVERGIGVLRFDFTGLGHSGGEFANSGFRANLDDIRSAFDYLKKNNAAPQILLGHSLGGTAMLATAHEFPEAILVASIGSPFQPAHTSHHFADALQEIKEKGVASVTLSKRTFTVTREFVEQLEGHDMAATIRSIKSHVLVFHDPEDDVVEIENARMIFEAARHPKSFLALPKAGHMLNNSPMDAPYVASIIAATAVRNLNLG